MNKKSIYIEAYIFRSIPGQGIGRFRRDSPPPIGRFYKEFYYCLLKNLILFQKMCLKRKGRKDRPDFDRAEQVCNFKVLKFKLQLNGFDKNTTFRAYVQARSEGKWSS